MDDQSIIAAIDAELARLEKVRELLRNMGGTSDAVVRGTRAGKKSARKRVLSAEARARIAAAQKRRWAKSKKQKTTANIPAKKAAKRKKAAKKRARPAKTEAPSVAAS